MASANTSDDYVSLYNNLLNQGLSDNSYRENQRNNGYKIFKPHKPVDLAEYLNTAINRSKFLNKLLDKDKDQQS